MTEIPQTGSYFYFPRTVPRVGNQMCVPSLSLHQFLSVYMRPGQRAVVEAELSETFFSPFQHLIFCQPRILISAVTCKSAPGSPGFSCFMLHAVSHLLFACYILSSACAGTSKVRPVGQMRPAFKFPPARRLLLLNQ